jgi:hypothetical protein
VSADFSKPFWKPSVGRLMEFLTAPGQDVAISVKPAGERKDDGAFSSMRAILWNSVPKTDSGNRNSAFKCRFRLALKSKEKGPPFGDPVKAACYCGGRI